MTRVDALIEDDAGILQEIDRLVTGHCDLGASRRVIDGGEAYHRDLWRALGDGGWLGSSLDARFGGVGLGDRPLCGIARALGRVLAPVPITSSIFIAAELLRVAASETQRGDLLPKLASGASIATRALVEGLGPLLGGAMQAQVRGSRLTGRKVAVPDATIADRAIVAARDDRDRFALFLVDLGGEGVEIQPRSSIDPSRPLADILFDEAPAERLEGQYSASMLDEVICRAAILTAFEQIGGAEACLAMACDYARLRTAFGRAVGSYQAIKHKLADVQVAIIVALANADHAAGLLSGDRGGLRAAACAARIAATAAFELAARETIQVHGGVGVTWEHDAQLFYRRSRYLALELGSADEWRDRLADELDRVAA